MSSCSPLRSGRIHPAQSAQSHHPANRVDDADLYFQYTRSEGWSLEEGIVKSGSSASIKASVCEPSLAKNRLRLFRRYFRSGPVDAARTVRTIAAAGQSRRIVKVDAHRVAASRSLYPAFDPIASLDSAAKVALLEDVERARAKDPRVSQVMVGLDANTTSSSWPVPTAPWPLTSAR